MQVPNEKPKKKILINNSAVGSSFLTNLNLIKKKIKKKNTHPLLVRFNQKKTGWSVCFTLQNPSMKQTKHKQILRAPALLFRRTKEEQQYHHFHLLLEFQKSEKWRQHQHLQLLKCLVLISLASVNLSPSLIILHFEAATA